MLNLLKLQGTLSITVNKFISLSNYFLKYLQAQVHKLLISTIFDNYKIPFKLLCFLQPLHFKMLFYSIITKTTIINYKKKMFYFNLRKQQTFFSQLDLTSGVIEQTLSVGTFILFLKIYIKFMKHSTKGLTIFISFLKKKLNNYQLLGNLLDLVFYFYGLKKKNTIYFFKIKLFTTISNKI